MPPVSQRRNKPEPTEALVERVREGLCPNWPHPGIVGCTYCIHTEDAGNALTELIERLAAAERERDEQRTRADMMERESLAEARKNHTTDARVKVLEEALGDLLRYVPEVGANLHAGYGGARQQAVAALSQVREP